MKTLGFVGLLMALSASASAQTPKPPIVQGESLLSAPLRQQEAAQLTAHSTLARREGATLILTYYTGTRHQQEVARLTDGDDGCARYVFIGAKRLFSGYLHAVTDMAEINCDNGEIAARFIVRHGWHLWTYTPSTATPDGRFLFTGGNPVFPERPTATVFSVAQNMAVAEFQMACPKAEALSETAFRIDCGTFSGEAFLDKGWKIKLKRYAGELRDTESQIIKPTGLSSTNGGDAFEDTREEAEALVRFPGLARRDGPDLVILEKGREVRRVTDGASGCPGRPFRGGPNRFWFHSALNLYDARTRTAKPVARIRCQAGEFPGFMFVPSQGDALYVPGQVYASPDGRSLVNSYNVLSIIDWPSRKEVLRQGMSCRNVVWAGSARFEALCDGDKKTIFQRKGKTWQVKTPA